MNGSRLWCRDVLSCCWKPVTQLYAPHGVHVKRYIDACAVSSKAWGDGKKKRRLDEVCCDIAPEYSRKVIQSFILAGKVFVNDERVTKAGHQIPASADVDIRAEVPKFVSRAGLKLEKAIHHFGISVQGLVCLDSGLSTGGFTDCLLQLGASKVYGVDVGYGQVAERVRTDSRVQVLERTNLRTLTPETLGGKRVQFITLDLSFISVLKVLPAVCAVAAPQAAAVVLIKPQFEAGLDGVSRGGVVKDSAVHEEVISKVTEGFSAFGWTRLGLTESPVRGAKGGNIEFLGYFVRNGEKCSADVEPAHEVEQ